MICAALLLALSGGAGVLKEHENLKFHIFFSPAQNNQFGLLNELERWCSNSGSQTEISLALPMSLLRNKKVYQTVRCKNAFFNFIAMYLEY